MTTKHSQVKPPAPAAASARHAPGAALTIAGMDSSGGAGIAADLRTFQAHGLHGAAAVTALTAQNAAGVQSCRLVPATLVGEQIRSAVTGVTPAAVKTGMLGNRAIVAAVAAELTTAALPLVVDPVIVATSGARLLAPSAVTTLCRRLLPLATVVTPNLPELEALSGHPVSTPAAQRTAARILLDFGCSAVLVKGGHGRGRLIYDRLITADGVENVFPHPRLAGQYHGTGCTLSAHLCAALARGAGLEAATAAAITALTNLLAGAWPAPVGKLYYLPPWPAE